MVELQRKVDVDESVPMLRKVLPKKYDPHQNSPTTWPRARPTGKNGLHFRCVNAISTLTLQLQKKAEMGEMVESAG